MMSSRRVSAVWVTSNHSDFTKLTWKSWNSINSIAMWTAALSVMLLKSGRLYGEISLQTSGYTTLPADCSHYCMYSVSVGFRPRWITYLTFDIWCYAKKQWDIEAQFDHVVPVLWGQQVLEEKSQITSVSSANKQFHFFIFSAQKLPQTSWFKLWKTWHTIFGKPSHICFIS